jgi:four helix bundle protein
MYEEKEKSFFRFEDLRVYDKALDYIEWVMKATQAIPEGKAQDLSSRFNHAAMKIATHIAEGSARKKVQFVLYLKMAKSMVRECIVYTTIMEQENYASEEEIEISRTHLMELTKMLGALIGSLQRPKGERRRYDDNKQNETSDPKELASDDDMGYNNEFEDTTVEFDLDDDISQRI